MAENNNEVQVITCEAIEASERANIDIQIATAHKYPRSLDAFNKRAIEMVSMDKETAESCIYKRPVGGGKVAEGESIRLAEIVASCFGNIRVACSLLEDNDNRRVRARGMAHDLESNNAQMSEVIESTMYSATHTNASLRNKPYDERMRILTSKVALSKARRDAIFMVIPKALCKKIKMIAKQVALGTRETIGVKVNEILKYYTDKKVSEKTIYEFLKIGGKADVGIDELETLIGFKTAIEEGDLKIEDAFKTESKEKSELETKREYLMKEFFDEKYADLKTKCIAANTGGTFDEKFADEVIAEIANRKIEDEREK